MITKNQIKEIAKFYKIDEFTIKREYLQLVFLNHFYQLKPARKIYLKGGTAIRLLFNSPRFSEDLDFSTFYSKERIRKIINETEKSITTEIANLQILPLYSAKEGERFRIKYQESSQKYPLTIRLDFHQEKKTEIGKTMVSPLLTRFPIIIFPLIPHLTSEEILKEKINALLERGKARDIFDIWFLLEKGVKIDKKIDKRKIIQKIKKYPQSKIEEDLKKFLPLPQRPILKNLKLRILSLLG